MTKLSLLIVVAVLKVISGQQPEPARPNPTSAPLAQLASNPAAGSQPATPPQPPAAAGSNDPVFGQNIVLSRTKPADLTPEELAIVNGLDIGNVHLPDRRGLLFFHLDAAIDNKSPKGHIEKQLSVDVRVYCVDADGIPSVTKFTKPFDLGSKGPQQVGLGGKVQLNVIKLRNNNSEIPKNVYVAFAINQKVFREIILTTEGSKEWWRQDELVKP